MDKKYYRYTLSYPLNGNVVYKSSSFPKVVRKCYGELKQMNMTDGLFCVTNLDKNVEYQFKINHGRAKRIKKTVMN